MTSIAIELPEDMVAILKTSRLGGRPVSDQVKVALAIQLLQEGLISAGKAAEIAGESRAAFELLLGEMGVPPVRHDMTTYRQERDALSRARLKQA